MAPSLADPSAEVTGAILCVARSSSVAVACSTPSTMEKSPYTIWLDPATSAPVLSAEIPGAPAGRLPSEASKACRACHCTAYRCAEPCSSHDIISAKARPIQSKDASEERFSKRRTATWGTVCGLSRRAHDIRHATRSTSKHRTLTVAARQRMESAET